jgi:hypothetical protein
MAGGPGRPGSAGRPAPRAGSRPPGPGPPDAACPHRDEPPGVARGEVEVVQHHHDGATPLAVQALDQVEHVDLVREVEVGRRLVEQEQIGALGERHRDPRALSLPAGELIEGPGGELGHAGPLECLADGRLVVRRPLPVPSLVGVPAAGDEVGDGQALGRDRRLRQHAEDLRDLAGGGAVDALAVEQHVALAGGQQPAQGAQEGRLAAAVGSDDRGDGAVEDVEVEAVDHDVVAVAQLQVARLQPGVVDGHVAPDGAVLRGRGAPRRRQVGLR